MPPVTMHLLIINGILWLATIVFKNLGYFDLTETLGLHFWRGDGFKLWQMVTYMFMHDSSGISHLFFNMFSLWMFGSLLEHTLGQKRYLIYYFFCGIGAGLMQELTWEFTWQSILADINNVPTSQISQALAAGQLSPSFLNEFYNNLITVGASGSIFGILLAYGMLYPNNELYIIPIPLPIKAKWYVIGYGVIELLFGVTGAMSGVAHFAHLGGMLFGIILLLYWRHERGGRWQGPRRGSFGGGSSASRWNGSNNGYGNY